MKRKANTLLVTLVFTLSLYSFFNAHLHNVDFQELEDAAVDYLHRPPLTPLGERKLASYLGPQNRRLLSSKGKPSDSTFSLERKTKADSTLRNDIANAPSDINLREFLDDFIHNVTTPTYYCSKLLKQGGRTCQRVPDGDKKLCVDAGMSPRWDSCIVYSMGVGHDFSYDYFMSKFGCQVFSFDHDYLHSFYERRPFRRVHFAQVRLGTMVQYKTVYDKVDKTTFTYFYRPLDNIMYILHHEESNIDVLKLDIEGAEFEVFEDSIFKTDILERTRQLSIEIHLEKFLDNKASVQTIAEYAKNYTRFFNGLRSRGLELAYYEPNFISSQTINRVAGVLVPVVFEQLWVNRRLKPGKKPLYDSPVSSYVKELYPQKYHLIQKDFI